MASYSPLSQAGVSLEIRAWSQEVDFVVVWSEETFWFNGLELYSHFQSHPPAGTRHWRQCDPQVNAANGWQDSPAIQLQKETQRSFLGRSIPCHCCWYRWAPIQMSGLYWYEYGANRSVVPHPAEWRWSGYNEIQNSKKRYTIINYWRLTELPGIDSSDSLKEIHGQWVEKSLKKRNFGFAPGMLHIHPWMPSWKKPSGREISGQNFHFLKKVPPTSETRGLPWLYSADTCCMKDKCPLFRFLFSFNNKGILRIGYYYYLNDMRLEN